MAFASQLRHIHDEDTHIHGNEFDGGIILDSDYDELSYDEIMYRERMLCPHRNFLEGNFNDDEMNLYLWED